MLLIFKTFFFNSFILDPGNVRLFLLSSLFVVLNAMLHVNVNVMSVLEITALI